MEPVGYLYNANKQQLGWVIEWVDEENEIPEKFKINKNRVQHPTNNQPLWKFIFNDNSSVYHSLSKGKEYTEFKFDAKDCNLKPTNEIKMI